MTNIINQTTVMSMVRVVIIGLLAGAVLFGWPRWQAYSYISEHADRISLKLSESIIKRQTRIDQLVAGSSGLVEMFAQLECEGPDKASLHLSGSRTFVINEPHNVEILIGIAGVQLDRKFTDYGWRRKLVEKRLPGLMDVCEGCELSHSYISGMQVWIVTKAVPKSVWYDKSDIKSDPIDHYRPEWDQWRLTNLDKYDTENGLPAVYPQQSELDAANVHDAKVDILVTWGPPRFIKKGEFVEANLLEYSGGLPNRTNKPPAPSYETHVTFCAYSLDDLTLLARRTIRTPAPLHEGEFGYRNDAPEDGLIGKSSDRNDAISFYQNFFATSPR